MIGVERRDRLREWDGGTFVVTNGGLVVTNCTA
jgi:hypothetical protein